MARPTKLTPQLQGSLFASAQLCKLCFCPMTQHGRDISNRWFKCPDDVKLPVADPSIGYLEVKRPVDEYLADSVACKFYQVVVDAAFAGETNAQLWLKGEITYVSYRKENGEFFGRWEPVPGRGSPEAWAWRTAVFERDGYRCRKCQGTEELHAHHIKSWADFPDLRFDVDNGITLCRSDHALKHPEIEKLILNGTVKAKQSEFALDHEGGKATCRIWEEDRQN